MNCDKPVISAHTVHPGIFSSVTFQVGLNDTVVVIVLTVITVQASHQTQDKTSSSW